MGLETGTYISDLVATNPVGAVDPKSQGDNHIRLLKSTIKATFPNITGAVTPTHTAINQTCVGTGGTFPAINGNNLTSLTADNISPGGTLPSLVGTALTALNASNLGSGTVPDARFPATLPAASGANLTALNASNISSGSLADGRLSANVPLINAANVFTAAQKTMIAGTTSFTLNNSNNNSTDQAHLDFQTNSAARGYLGVGNLVTGATRADITLRAVAGGLFFTGDDGTTAHFALSSAGVLTTPNASASEVGYKGVPQNSQSVDYTAVLADASKVLHQTGASKTFTIPANGSVAYPIGTALTFSVANATGVTIAITTDTLRLAGVGTTGSRTLAQYGVATAIKIAATEWYISGAGLT